MKTAIKYLDAKTGSPSNCGEPLQIEVSSRHLEWKDILVERGVSPFFYPQEVMTASFYFAMELEHHYSWHVGSNLSNITIDSLPGDIWINPPYTPFSHIIHEPCSFLIVTITPDLLFEYFGQPLPCEKLTFLNNYSIQDKTIEYVMRLLYLETINKGQNGKIYRENLLRLFACYYIPNYSNYWDILGGRQSSTISDETLERIDRYILERIGETLTIDELAQICNMSKFHFLNEFKKVKAITPYQYIILMKIEQAKKLLITSAEQIVHIGLRLGFNDNSHFTRTFKKLTDQTPSQYRNSIKGKPHKNGGNG